MTDSHAPTAAAANDAESATDDLPPDDPSQPILVTGVTGYVGGRLTGKLVERGLNVRVLVRESAERIEGRGWEDAVDVVVGDVSSKEDLARALAGVGTAYYLVHSMRVGDDYDKRDARYARNFAEAAEAAGVTRIVYLGGLGRDDDDLSKHLESRHQTGRLLASGAVPVVELRAAVIVGSGSLSFEIVRALAERLPAMIFPRWAETRIQPIGIADVLSYLAAARRRPPRPQGHEIIEIGGGSVETFGGMIEKYAKARGLKRFVVRVPFISPWLSSWWVHWTTPVTADIARPLIEGAEHEVIVETDRASEVFPHIEPLTYDVALQRALDRIEKGQIESIWSDAQVKRTKRTFARAASECQGMLIETREGVADASCEAVFRAFCSFGGERGWPYHWLWVIRGWMDQAVGGVGLRRGRRDPDELRVGDALDFWRVEDVEPGQRLLLRAEMKVPGYAWLRFETFRRDGETHVIQNAFFAPRGFLGLCYWYSIYPLHGPIFGAMLQTVVDRAEAETKSPERVEAAA